MSDRTIRTIGASIVLAGIAVAGIAQLENRAPAQSAEIATVEPSTSEARVTGEEATTPEPDPFVYRIGVLSSITTDNFWAYYGGEASVWNSYILGPTKPALYRLDAATGELASELISGGAALTWNEHGWRVRLEIDPRFSWSDGEPVTAEDFAFTFETVRSLGLAGSWLDAYPSVVTGVHADGEHQLRIEFSERPNLSVWPHGVGLAPVMAEHVWQGRIDGVDAAGLYAMPGVHDVSGGPLTLVAASEGLAVSNSNPGYPRNESPDTVEYHVYADEAALVAGVARGEIDSILSPKGLATEHLAMVEGDPNVAVVSSPANGVRYLGFNLAREPMSDHAFRTALALLVDREGLAGEILQRGDPAWSVVPASNGQWYDEDAANENRARYDGDMSTRLAKALEGLQGAGYGWATPPRVGDDGTLIPGEGLTMDGRSPQPLTILTPGDAYDPARPDYVQAIANTLGVLGFDTRPVETDFDTVVDLAFTPGEDGALHYDMYLLGWTLGNPALPGYYRPFFSNKGELNNTGYASDVFNQSLRAYERAHTTEDARAALWSMERALATELPYLLLYTSQLTEVYRADRVTFDLEESLGGLQGRLGGIGDVRPSE